MNETVQIIYGSKRGVTKRIAYIINDTLTSKNINTIIKNVFEVRVSDLLKYKLNIFGSSTWANGDLQSDFLDFEKEMDYIDLTGTYSAVFGPGSSRFPMFCEAVEILQAKCISCGAKLIIPSLKLDELSGRMEDETKLWADQLAECIRGIEL